MRGQLRRAMPVTALAAATPAAFALALAFAAESASADASCTKCHAGFQSYPGMTCWSQPDPGRSTCTECHGVALPHDNGYQCTLRHRRAVHATRPSATH